MVKQNNINQILFSNLAFAVFLSCLFINTVAFGRPTYGHKAVVVSASDLASKAAITALKKGGNIVDAAVAAEFVLAVTRPYYASLGGGGFILVKLNGQIRALDFRERAPLKATKDMYLNAPKDASTIGGLAVATPGMVMGFYNLHKLYGKRSWKENLGEAVKLAREGFVLTEEFVRLSKENRESFSGSGKEIFNSKSLVVGQVFRQEKLARALELIQKNGASGFYQGDIAKDLVQSVKNQGGILSMEDLKSYNVRWLEPLRSSVYGTDIWTMPPPSSGGAILLSELKLAEKIKLETQAPFSAEEYFLLSEIMRRSFYDRKYLADPTAMKINPQKLFSSDRVEQWAKTIQLDKKANLKTEDFEIQEGANTTHFNIMDAQGNALAATITVNTEYGSGVFTEKYGINLNNEMDDFTTRPGKANAFGLTQGEANQIAPGKTPLSSMTPTIVEKNGKTLLVAGAPGGPRIINAVFQGIYRALNSKFNLDEIVQTPRVHHQWSPDRVQHDSFLSPSVVKLLNQKGFETVEGPTARLYMIRMNEASGLIEGAFDSRGEGGASAY